MFEDAKKAIAESSKSSSVYIGSDSIRYKKSKGGAWYARYSTVVVLHMDSCHGGKIFHHTFKERDFGNLHQRLMREVSLAAEAAMEIIPHLDGRRMEVHIDVNPNEEHASYIACKEALGWIRGLGLEARIKPDSWAATHAADHAVRNLH